MLKLNTTIGATLLVLCAVGVVTTASIASTVKEKRAAKLSAYQPVGKPVSCLSLVQIRDTEVLDNRTVDFHVSGGKIYRNTLSHSCPSLLSEQRFSYRTSLNKLCDVDVIRVLHTYGTELSEGAGCGLGKFQPMEKVTPAQ